MAGHGAMDADSGQRDGHGVRKMASPAHGLSLEKKRLNGRPMTI